MELITFTNPFKTVNYAVGITGQGMATGEYFLVESKTINGFNVTFKNVLDKDRVYNSFTKVITNTLTPLKYLPKHFKFVFRVHNLAMLDDSWWYDVKLSSQKLSQFKNPSVNYFVAMEPTSEFEQPKQLINKKNGYQKKIISLSNNIAKLQKQLSVLRSA